ncbi:MAG: APC family permease [Candidatus Bathyarchaeia archaeon]
MESKYFVRKASGLVREFGATDLILIASAMVFGLVFTTTQFPWFYGFNPGANLALSLTIAGIPFVFLMLVYWVIGVIMPRSGSDYVWVSRVFHPSIGFAWSFLYMFAVFITAYVGGLSAFSYALSIAVTMWGLLFQNPGLVTMGNFLSSPIGAFYIAVGFTLLFAVFAIFGVRLIKGLLYISWGAAILGIVLMWWLLGTTNPAMFAAKWNAVMTNYPTYQALQQAATQNGWTPPVGGLVAVMGALPLASLFLFGGNFGGNVIAGEIKDVRKTVPLALFLSLILGIVYWSVSGFLTLNAVGENWFYSIAYLWDNNPAAYGALLPFPPSQPLLLSVIAYPSAALLALIFLTYFFGSVQILFVYFWVPSRYFFAWSFDRIIPTRFADVSKRFHTPHIAVGAMTVLSVILLGLYAFTSWPTAFTIGTFLWGVAYIVPALATIVFPFTKKDLFEQAPEFMRKKIGSVPIISILGVLASASFAYMGYIAYTNPLITSPTLSGIGIAVGILIACFIVYFASLAYHKKRGLDIEMAFKELPPV